MDFTINNGLSMIGGDELSAITASIAVLDASVVHKTGNLTESIDGPKTFTSNLAVNNANTTITATGTATDGLITLNATDPTISGLYGQVQAYADTKIQLKINANNSQVVLTPSSVSIIGDTTDTTTKTTETHNIGELASLTSGTFNVTDLVTTQTLLTLNDNYVKLQAPNFGGQLDLAGSLCHFDGVPSGTNAIYFGSIVPFNTIGFHNTNLEILNTDVGITQDATNTAGRSMGISVKSTCIGDLVFYLNKRTSASFFTASGWRSLRENATGSYLFQKTAVSSGGLGTNTTIQTIDSGGTTETFTCATQNKVASTAFNITDGTLNHLAITPTLTTETNATITNVASTAFKVQNVSGTDKLNIAPSLTTLTNPTITNVATTSFKVQNVAGTDKLIIGSSTTTITNTNIEFSGQATATRYSVGLGGTTQDLISIIKEGTLPMGVVQATDLNMRLGAINSIYTCTIMSYPYIVRPISFQVFIDSGAITGTAPSVSMIVSVYNVTTSTAIATSSAFTISVASAEAQASGLFPTPTNASASDVLRIRFRYSVTSGTLTGNLKVVTIGIQFQQR